MSNALNPIQPRQSAEATTPGVAATPATRPAAAATTPTPASEAVTLSEDAHASTQFLNAARNAPGIDQVTVVRLQTAIQAGIYNVAPETLAAAIQNAARNQY